MDRLFLKHGHAQNLHNPTQTFVDSMDLIETGHHEVHADRDPDLSSYGVFTGSAEGFV